MTDLPKASFWHRLIASLLDTMILIVVSALFLLYASAQPTLPRAIFSLTLFIVLILLNPVVYLSGILLTHYFGGTLGKLLSGLYVTNEHGKRLSFKRIAFRQTLGYQFSALVFGLGYFAILKDPNSQAWHDKTVGSVVLVKRPLWILGLVFFIGLSIVTFFILMSAITSATTGPLKDETQRLFLQNEVQEKLEETKREEFKQV